LNSEPRNVDKSKVNTVDATKVSKTTIVDESGVDGLKVLVANENERQRL
jgi:hypothetical protein